MFLHMYVYETLFYLISDTNLHMVVRFGVINKILIPETILHKTIYMRL